MEGLQRRDGLDSKGPNCGGNYIAKWAIVKRREKAFPLALQSVSALAEL